MVQVKNTIKMRFEKIKYLYRLHPPDPLLWGNGLIPQPPSPRREGGKEKIINLLSPSLLGEGFRVR